MSGIAIGIVGASGRMGQMLAREAHAAGFRLVGGTEAPGSPNLGKDIGDLVGLGPLGATIGDDPLPLFANADAVLDFTVPAATRRHAEIAAQAKCPIVIGTTGLEAEDLAAIERAARHTPIVRAANTSLGVTLLLAVVKQVAATLDEDFDIEIVEMHHRMKVDAPSGTALALGEAAAAGRKVKLADVADRGRDGITGARKRGAIGFAALRGGNVAGDHTVIFAADDERIEITHKATSRAIFARGALKAAQWLQGRQPGLYSMADVLGLGT
jgi:4-hydroxy-tetrahydrodipicolinate reductase